MKKTLSMAMLIATVIMMSGCSSSDKALSWVDVNANDVPQTVTKAPTKTKQTVNTVVVTDAAAEKAAQEAINKDVQTIREEVEVVFGDASQLKTNSVVVGVFSQIDNAKNYYSRMAGRGFTPLVVKNAAGLYRVVAFSSDSASEAWAQRNAIREAYASDGANLCDRAWVLVKK